MRFVLKKGHSTLDEVIKWFSWGQYSHASLLSDSNYVIEAVYPKVRTLHFDLAYPLGTVYDIFNVETTEEQHKEIIRYAGAQVGKKYDFIGDLHFVLKRKPSKEEYDKWFCSRLVFKSFKYVGIELLSRIQSYKVNPTMLSWSPLAKML